MNDSLDTSDREAIDPREPIRLPVREMRDEPVPHQPADPLRAALQLALEATPEQLSAAMAGVYAELPEWDIRGVLASLKCWHRLTEEEAADLVEFAQRHGIGTAKSAQPEEGRPDIIERLTYHAMERDDLTLDECLRYLSSGWKTVHGRTERQMVMQILAMLATQPDQGVVN
jgi:hypothetical protein